MKNLIQIAISIAILLISFLIIINIPFEEKVSTKLNDNILLIYSKGIGIGGIVSLAMLNNGVIVNYDVHLNKTINQLSSEELNQLRSAINNNQFEVSKISLLNKWKGRLPGCFDCDMSVHIYINKNGETIKVGKSDIIWNIVSKLKLF
ncbi:MAG: hypothetical protein AABW58_02560 [Nanoarchaeota archaeon]